LNTRTSFVIGDAPFYTSLVLVAAVWYLIGRLVSGYAAQHMAQVTVEEDSAARTGVVQIEGVRDGDITGTIDGDVRVFLGDEIITPESNGVFTVPATALLTNEIGVIIPSGTQYVASKKGTKYYPVFSPQGERIVPENRVYFRTAEEAEAAGFSS